MSKVEMEFTALEELIRDSEKVRILDEFARRSKTGQVDAETISIVAGYRYQEPVRDSKEVGESNGSKTNCFK